MITGRYPYLQPHGFKRFLGNEKSVRPGLCRYTYSENHLHRGFGSSLVFLQTKLNLRSEKKWILWDSTYYE